MSESRDELLKAWLDAEDDYRQDVSQYFVTSVAGAPLEGSPKVLQREDFARFDEKSKQIDELRARYQASWRG